MPFSSKESRAEYYAAYYRKHRERIVERMRKFRKDNPERVHAQSQKCYLKHHADRLAKMRARHLANKEKDAAYGKKYRETHKEQIRAYHEKNRNRINEWRRLWWRDHLEECRAKKKAYRLRNINWIRMWELEQRQKESKRMEKDAVEYAAHRRYHRIRYAVGRIRKGAEYRPRKQCRIPDYMRKGEAKKNEKMALGSRHWNPDGETPLFLKSANLKRKIRARSK